MNICIDARWIFPKLSGIGLYTQELIRALVRVDTENNYTLLFNDPAVLTRTEMLTGAERSPRFRSRLIPYGLFTLRNQFALPRWLKREGFDLYHSTNYMMPLPRPGHVRRVVTIHDLIPLLFPDHAPRSKKTRLFPLYKKINARSCGARGFDHFTERVHATRHHSRTESPRRSRITSREHSRRRHLGL
ncbi:MAG: glycosyltransferase [Kiritimatiellae bacterium]|nr:glycosyltransferase [Kiritimatiellia bacterium]